MSCECSVGRLCTDGTRSHVIVIVFEVCACRLAGFDVSLQYVVCVLKALIHIQFLPVVNCFCYLRLLSCRLLASLAASLQYVVSVLRSLSDSF